MHVVVLYLLSFGVLLALADVTYNIDDTDPSITYVGRWHQENDYTTSYNFTLSDALDQDDDTTASLIFYGVFSLSKPAIFSILANRDQSCGIRNREDKR